MKGVKNSVEYEKLREELMFWFKTRQAVIHGIVVLIPVVLGWAITNPRFFSWAIVSSICLSIISAGAHLTRIYTRNIVVIAGYLRRFCNSDYEKRIVKLNPDKGKNAINFSLAFIYLIFSFISILIPLIVCRKDNDLFYVLSNGKIELITFCSIALLFVVTLFRLLFMNLNKMRVLYFKEWGKTKKKNPNKNL